MVRFDTDMSHCAYIATPGASVDSFLTAPVEVTVASLSGGSHGLFIQTFDQSTGALTDEPFHVTTYCGTTADYAVIGDDGSTARGSHVVSSSEITPGRYEVIFDHNVSTCAFTATLGTIADGEIDNPGEINVAGRTGNKNGVFVETLDRTGTDAPFSFHLAVNCGATAVFGVIDFDGTKVRGSHVVSAGEVGGLGGYGVLFNRNVAQCAFTATVGEPHNKGALSAPVTITTATSSSEDHGVFLFITDVTSLEGVEQPFHLVVTC